MQRDDDLIRNLLLETERLLPRSANGLLSVKEILFSEDDDISVASEEFTVANEHMRLLMENGFVDGVDDGQSTNPYNRIIRVYRLTWSGHDFLDNIRDPDIWLKTKEGAKASGGFTIDILSALAKGFVKQKIQHHTGVEIEL